MCLNKLIKPIPKEVISQKIWYKIFHKRNSIYWPLIQEGPNCTGLILGRRYTRRNIRPHKTLWLDTIISNNQEHYPNGIHAYRNLNQALISSYNNFYNTSIVSIQPGDILAYGEESNTFDGMSSIEVGVFKSMKLIKEI